MEDENLNKQGEEKAEEALPADLPVEPVEKEETPAEAVPVETPAEAEPAEKEGISAEPAEIVPAEMVPAEEKAQDPAEVSVPAEAPAEAPKEDAPIAGERRWYVIQALTGQEDKVKQSIEGLKHKISQVLVPTEETVEIKGGKRLKKVKKMFPGYVFLEMILDEESWYHIRETPGVARFIGTKVQPTPVSEKEMQRVLKQLGKEERLEVTFEKGEAVRVISGAFRGYTGTVDEVNVEKEKLKVLINIFGRDTPVEVNFEHSQKIV